MMWAVICVVIVILNVVDGVFTVSALDSGRFVEINPLMDYVIRTFGTSVFFWGFKCAFPAICMAIAAYGVKVRAPHIKKALAVVLFMYICLTLWHIYLRTL